MIAAIDALPLLIRTFTRPVEDERSGQSSVGHNSRPPKAKPKPLRASDWSIVFDTETTIDPRQRFRLGVYRIYDRDRLDEERFFFDPDVLSFEEKEILHAYARNKGLPPAITLAEFREEVLLKRGYAIGARIIGFNLPFDLSRVALDAAPARPTKYRTKFRGGFSFKLSNDPHWPKIQVKHIGPKAAFMEFTVPGNQQTSRSMRKTGRHNAPHRGVFIDVKTLAGAILSQSHSLKSLAVTLKSPTQKVDSEEHGKDLTPKYLDYARDDVQITWECFLALEARYAAFGLSGELCDLVSEASIGKATFDAIGVRPLSKMQPDIPAEETARILSTYYGGRTEVRIRRKPVRVVHTDFTSMYPTVCTLMNLWSFIIGQGYRTADATDRVRTFLAETTADDLMRQEPWPLLNVIVKVRPRQDRFPVRSYFSRRNGKPDPSRPSIALSELTSDQDHWFTLADCLVSKLQTGRPPEIVEAIAFSPGPPQAGLRNIRLLGETEINPYRDDLFKLLIESRQADEARKAHLPKAQHTAIEQVRDAKKILANSTSYGVFVQVNVDTEPTPRPVRVYTPDGSSFVCRTRKIERPGPYFHPLLATLITGAARLLLALAEYQTRVRGLDWAFCDTDSLAIAQPEGMARADFARLALEVPKAFEDLNPYAFDGSILKIEKVNYDYEEGRSGELRPLYCFAISSKRYALFNLDAAGRPVVRKASAHGLGHLLAPYDKDADIKTIPKPLGYLLEGKDRVARWHYDVWYTIVSHALSGASTAPSFSYHPALQGPAVSRYGATSPELLSWFDHLNDGRPYEDQVKPHGFMYALHANRSAGRSKISPVAPFERDLKVAIAAAFDRNTGEPVSADQLESYAQALAPYPFHPEDKFLNGRAFDQGETAPRHVQACQTIYIGKEADHWEESFMLGQGGDIGIAYGADPNDAAGSTVALREAVAAFGALAVSEATGVPRSTLAKVVQGSPAITKVPHYVIASKLKVLWTKRSGEVEERKARLRHWKNVVDVEGGIRPAARKLGIDASNLAKALRNAG